MGACSITDADLVARTTPFPSVHQDQYLTGYVTADTLWMSTRTDDDVTGYPALLRQERPDGELEVIASPDGRMMDQLYESRRQYPVFWPECP